MCPDDPAVQTFFLQKSVLIDYVESGDDLRCKCGAKVECIKVDYEYTAGRFQFQCTNKTCKKKLSPLNTQRHNGDDYTLNQHLLASNEMNCSNLTRLNNVLTSLRAATIPESFHAKICNNLIKVVTKQAKESVDEAFDEFKEQERHDCSADAGFSKARDAPYCDFSVVNDSNNKIIHQHNMEVKTETPTANAWKAEDYGAEMWFKKLEDLKCELDDWIHDACAQLTKRVAGHTAFFKQLNANNPNWTARTNDNNDTWHSARSYLKLWFKVVEMHTSCCKRGNKKKGISRDTKATIKWRTDAAEQLRCVKTRVKQAFMQVTGSIHKTYGSTITPEEKGKKAVEALANMLIDCLIRDDHAKCIEICGDACPCAGRRRWKFIYKQITPAMTITINTGMICPLPSLTTLGTMHTQ